MAIGYDELASFKGKMYRAAIDCWMADQSFTPPWGAEHTYAKWGFAPFQYHRPDENGVGGGASVGYGDGVNCEAQFDQIRAAIDAIVDPWLSLPDSAGSAPHAASAEDASAFTGNSGANSPGLEGPRNQVERVATLQLKGQFVAPFVDKYCSQLMTVAHGIGDGCLIVSASHAAEVALWPAAREDVTTICLQAQAAWEAVAAKRAAANAEVTFAVIGAVASGVAAVLTAVLTAGTSLAATTVSSAVAIAHAAKGALGVIGGAASVAIAGMKYSAAVTGDSYSGILTSLSESFQRLTKTINEQDGHLRTMLSEMDSEVFADRASYDLDYFELGDYPTTDGTIVMDSTSADLVKNAMTRVHGELSSAQSKLGAAPTSNPSTRPMGIGVSTSGTFGEAAALHGRLHGCITRTTNEYDRGRQLFDATVADYFQTDANASTTVQNLQNAEAEIESVIW